MSTYWGYICRDCNEESDHWFNHGDEQLAQVAIARRIVEESGHDFSLVSVSIADSHSYINSEVGEFLEDHLFHNIALISEYGRVQELEDVVKIAETAPPIKAKKP